MMYHYFIYTGIKSQCVWSTQIETYIIKEEKNS